MAEKYKIMVVDDEPYNLKLMEGILVQDGFDVALSESGEACLQLVPEFDPDLIILDVMMPEMTGFEVCQELKLDANTRDIPVMFITALDKREDILNGYDLGGADFIPKPIDNTIVGARVKALLTMQRVVQDREILLKANHVLLGRLDDMLGELSLQTKLETVRKDLGEVTEGIFNLLDNLRDKVNEEEALGFIEKIQLSLQFTDRMGQQINEISKMIRKIQNLIKGEDEEHESADESTPSVLMEKKDQKEIDDLLDDLGF